MLTQIHLRGPAMFLCNGVAIRPGCKLYAVSAINHPSQKISLYSYGTHNPLITQPLCKFRREPCRSYFTLKVILHPLQLNRNARIIKLDLLWLSSLKQGHHPNDSHTHRRGVWQSGSADDEWFEQESEKIWTKAICRDFQITSLFISIRHPHIVCNSRHQSTTHTSASLLPAGGSITAAL